jgi:hypothetical protein
MENLVKNQLLFLVLILGFMSLFTQCTKDDKLEPEVVLEVNGNGYSNFNNRNLQSLLNKIPNAPLSTDEESGLLFMREEEKLAHDVYVQLYITWGTPIFNNIAASEQTHTDAIKLLLDKYDLTDPVGNNLMGVFVDTILQSLHDNLMADGVISLVVGLKVGAIIEEVDILDLQEQLANNVDNADIELVYNNLLKGSRNHLRAFVKELEINGVPYVPQLLTPEAYKEIIDSNMERGG